MEHLLLKAATTAADQGIFEAVISTATADREKDVVSPDGMVRALQKWATQGKKIPLAWNHSSKAEDQIGYIEPASAKSVNGEVSVQGFIDQSTEVGAHAWRLVKSGTLGFSFGYLILSGSKLKGGGRNIAELDVFEVTATPTPMNNDTRVLSFKAVDGEAETEEVEDDLRRRADEVELQFVSGGEKGEPAAEVKDLPDGADWLFPDAELKAARAGDLKAVWTTMYVNDLPDSAFLYIESGGDKDSDGKTTPRSLRHFPYKDASGAVDLPHLRNALSRIPQSDLPSSVQDELTAKAQRILNDQNKSVDVIATKPTRARAMDPLRERADALALEFASGGESLRKPPRTKSAPKPTPELDMKELRERMRAETLTALSGVEHESL